MRSDGSGNHAAIRQRWAPGSFLAVDDQHARIGIVRAKKRALEGLDRRGRIRRIDMPARQTEPLDKGRLGRARSLPKEAWATHPHAVVVDHEREVGRPALASVKESRERAARLHFAVAEHRYDGGVGITKRTPVGDCRGVPQLAAGPHDAGVRGAELGRHAVLLPEGRDHGAERG